MFHRFSSRLTCPAAEIVADPPRSRNLFVRTIRSAGQFDVFEEAVVVGRGVILPEVDAPGFQSAWTA
ncbi:MAG TPA: hypothetical protein PK054_00765, partial [Anaerohalosphaeraceae bacterium]|nr:hypothetical protein [Anaerohalosphaeraceae bacterium]HPP55095.1 hypothetical protein [Anaerohalosphaeraceae bacterium]